MAHGADSQLDPVVGLEAPERDRLYREWILPHLKLADDHRDFVETVLFVPGAKDFHTFPGTCSVTLDEHAPVDRLSKLSCCSVRERNLELAGPREGGLLIPVTDPHGRIVAFRILSNSQMARMREGHEPDTVIWWQAASSLRPMMPNGEVPVHAARSGTADTVVLMKGVARASAIAANWECHGVSTTEDTFSFHTTADYVQEFHPRHVVIFSARNLPKKEALRVWSLADQLATKELDVKILVPVLSDLSFPSRIGECTNIANAVWIAGLPKGTQQEITRKKRAAGVVESAKLNLSSDELNERILEAYNEFIDDEKKPDISSLAAAAGVHWEKVMDWLKDRGVDNTTQLQVKMDSGWDPPDEIDPLDPPPETRASEDGPSLFEYAESVEAQKASLDEVVPEVTTTDEPATSESSESHLEKAVPAAPVPTTGNTVDTPRTQPPSATNEPKQDGTIELVVEAKESILESETPLTQIIRSSDSSSQTETPGTGPESKARVGLILIAIALLAVAFTLIGMFGLTPKDTDTPWNALPISNKELLPSLQSTPLNEPTNTTFDLKEIAGKIKNAKPAESLPPPSEEN